MDRRRDGSGRRESAAAARESAARKSTDKNGMADDGRDCSCSRLQALAQIEDLGLLIMGKI